jgi:hypothetical protein
LAEVFDHDRGTNGTFTLSIEGDGGIFEVSFNPISFFFQYYFKAIDLRSNSTSSKVLHGRDPKITYGKLLGNF